MVTEMNENRSALNELREKTVEGIKTAMKGLKELNIVDIEEGNSPIIYEGRTDSDTYTLDRIEIGDDGSLELESSSSDDNRYDSDEFVSVEALLEIQEFLEFHKDEIDELVEEDSKKKFVIRFYWRQWVDITVNAKNLEEAYELAGERYNEGDYEEDGEYGNYENEDCVDVTEIYEEDKLPYPNDSEDDD